MRCGSLSRVWLPLDKQPPRIDRCSLVSNGLLLGFILKNAFAGAYPGRGRSMGEPEGLVGAYMPAHWRNRTEIFHEVRL